MEKAEILQEMAEILRRNGYRVEKIGMQDLPTIKEFIMASNLSAMSANVLINYYEHQNVSDLQVLIDDCKSWKLKKLRQFGKKSFEDLKNELKINFGVDV